MRRNPPDKSPKSWSSAAVTAAFGGENAFFCASLRVATGDLTGATPALRAPDTTLPAGDPLDCPVETVLVPARRGVVDVTAPFAFMAGLSSFAFLASVALAKGGRRVAGAVLFVSRWTRGLEAAAAAPLVACASPGFSFFYSKGVRRWTEYMARVKGTCTEMAIT